MRFSAILCGLLAVVPLAALAQAPPEGQGRKAALQKFDTNGDGRLDAEERKAAQQAVGQAFGGREAIMKRFDTNGNGKIDPDERAAIQKAMADRGGNREGKPGQAPNGPRMSREEIMKRFDSNGNGRIDPEERAAIQKEMAGKFRPGQGQGKRPSREEILKKFDANNNGRLDPAELAKLRETMGRRPGQPGAGDKPANDRKPGQRPDRKPNAKPNGKPNAANAARMLDRLPPQAKQRLLQQFDANNNGELEPAELMKAREMMGNRGGGNRAGFGLIPNEPTAPTLDQTELLKQFDANNNGKLDPQEKAAAARKLRS